MAIRTPTPSTTATGSEPDGSFRGDSDRSLRQLIRWGGLAGVAGFAALLGSVLVVVGMDLPDASDVETLTDFADIETGRIAEHFFYLGALLFFALHVGALYRVLRPAHLAAALFGSIMAMFGYVIMAASSLLHVSTAPLSELYTAAGTTPEDLRAIEYAWHGAQSIFDTMLTTGVLVVPIGIVLFGVAMRNVSAFGRGLAGFTMIVGTLGVIGGVVATVDPGSMFSAASVLAIALFHLIIGGQMLRFGLETAAGAAGSQ